VSDSRTDSTRTVEARLPPSVRAGLFDLDGVLTHTALLHAAAWKESFDEVLQAIAEQRGTEFVPFDASADYLRYVDGLPRLDGIHAFLAARNIDLPAGSDGGGSDGDSSDGDSSADPAPMTIAGLARRKNDLFNGHLERDGVQVIEPSRAFVTQMHDAGIPCAIVSSSTNAAVVVERADMAGLFELQVDGVVAKREHLAGKPAPDTFVYGARLLGVDPADAAVFEDAVAGVQAGRAGGFGFVVGIGAGAHAQSLLVAGADVVVADLGELSLP